MLATSILFALLSISALLGLAMVAVGAWVAIFHRADEADAGAVTAVFGAFLALAALIVLGIAIHDADPTCDLHPAVLVEVP